MLYDNVIACNQRGQCLSREWRTFVTLAAVSDIRMQVAHPESNGRAKRLHHLRREKRLAEELTDYAQAVAALGR